MPRIGAALLVLVLAPPARSALADDRLVVVDNSDLTSSDMERCTTEGGIVGRRPCPPYGMWGAALEGPYLFVSFGLNIRRLPRAQMPPAPISDAAAARTTTTGSTMIGELGTDTSYSFTERFGIAMTRFAYAGVEAEISPTTPESVEPGTRTFSAGAQVFLGLQGGTRLIKLGAELAGGARLVETQMVDSEIGEELMLEARARGDFWVTPWVTIGAAIGKSLIDRDEWVTGIHIGVHTYSYGGY